tara:strand:+ start:234 stop:1028 length:795 start_codon:yes stop_codon:yes gene_type:complete
MAISVDTVYQTVLALCNKEQRGYITPQEFNIMARKAQLEIFENYFHDMKTSSAKMNDPIGVAFGEVDILEEKLRPFLKRDTFNNSSSSGAATGPDWNLNSDIHFIKNVFQSGSAGDYAWGREVMRISKEEAAAIGASGTSPGGGWSHPLLRPTQTHLVYEILGQQTAATANGEIRIFPTPEVDNPEYFTMWYYRKPVSPNWAYFVVKKRALYRQDGSTNFELHESEEQLLVSRILQLAGVVIQKPGLVEVGAAEATSIKSQQND